MRFEIDENNAIKMFMDGDDVPFLFQPHYPNGDAWTSEQATAWAEACIAYNEDPEAPMPGPSAEEPTTPRPEPVEETPVTEE